MQSAPSSPAAASPQWPRWAIVLVVLVALVTLPLVYAGAQKKTVVLMGDSLMFESAWAVNTYLEFQNYTVSASAVPGSGLLDTEFDWLARARQVVAQQNPDIVVVEFIGNYGLLGLRPGVASYNALYYKEWAATAQQLEDILTSRGATVYWVIGPPVEQPLGNGGIAVLDQIYADLQAPQSPTGHPPLINVTPALTGGTGKYSEYLRAPDGVPVAVRTPDGTHFTVYGIALFGRAIAQGIT